MDYKTFEAEMLRDSSRRPGRKALDGSTIRAYFDKAGGEDLDPSHAPKLKDAFWFAYEQGGLDASEVLTDFSRRLGTLQSIGQ